MNYLLIYKKLNFSILLIINYDYLQKLLKLRLNDHVTFVSKEFL
jgi:hypothetical protein